MAGDIKGKYLTSVVLATPGSVNGSSSYTGGYITDVVDVSAISGGPPTDLLLTGHFVAPAANMTGGNIEMWVIAAERDTPQFPAGFDTTAAPTGTMTVPSRNSLLACGRLGSIVVADAVASRQYTVAPFSVSSLFGGSLPRHFRVFLTHLIATNGNAWASSGHEIAYMPMLLQYT